MQGPGSFIAVTGPEFGQPQRQVTVAFQTLVVHLDMTGTIHRLDGVIAILGLGGKHALAKFLPVPGTLPQAPVHDLGSMNFLIAVLPDQPAYVILNQQIKGPAFVVPENHSRSLVL